MSAPSPQLRAPVRPSHNLSRWLLLALTIGAFAHVAIALGMKDLWWDESLSLQRAESGLWPLLRGLLILKDGIGEVPTIDQHPFFYFLLQGLLVRTAGESEYALRFVSAMAATLLVPSVYVLSHHYVRNGVLPRSAPLWSALLAATSPFFLWYGQEARPYALWAMLAVLSTYLLLRSVAPSQRQIALRKWRIGYAIALLCFLATHYFAIFLLPIHALVLYLGLRDNYRRLALLLAIGLLMAGAGMGLAALWLVLRQGGGGNFQTITLAVLLPDLLNAFSMGLSVDISKVRWLDYTMGAIALLGGLWMLRLRDARSSMRWVIAASLLTPIAILFTVNLMRPVYMNARHMSLIAGFYIILLGAGLSVIQSRLRGGRIVAAALAVLMLAGSAYSTFNYYTQEFYAKDNFTALGEYMNGRIMAGDAVLYFTPASWRTYDYYTPLHHVRDAIAQGAPMALYGVPLLDDNSDKTIALLEDLGKRYRRIWFMKSGTVPYIDPNKTVENWLRDNYLLVRDAEFYSVSTLHAQLYLPQVPVYEEMPPGIQMPTQIVFGDQVQLDGYSIDADAWAARGYGLPLPVTLYWQAANGKPTVRYKYVLSLVAPGEGAPKILGIAEHEPYEGAIPTIYWDPGKIIAEYIELEAEPPPLASTPVLSLRIYDAETLEVLPVTASGGNEVLDDGFTVVLPLPTVAAGPESDAESQP